MGFSIENSSPARSPSPKQRKRQRRPHGGVGVLTAVLAQARRVGLDVAGVVRGVIERRREQFHEAVAAADQLGIDRRHGAERALAFGAAAVITAHDCAMESMRHSSLDTEPKGVPSS